MKIYCRDKLENIDRDLEARDGYYYTTYGKHIVAEYRKGLCTLYRV
jgi:hypothetical protein